MKTTKEIYNEIKDELVKFNRYDSALDNQILSLAGAMRSLIVASAEIDNLESVTVIEQSRYGEKHVPHPAFKVQRDAAEVVTKMMKVLGLTTDSLGAGVETDPLVALTIGANKIATGKK